MKKIATAAVLFAFVLSACVPAFAQKAKSTRPSVSVSKSGSVQFERVEAFSDGQGVLVRWQMVSETHNAGFYLYRVGLKGLELVNGIMVLGRHSRVKDQTFYGEQYQQYDPQGTSSTTYVVQSLTLDGQRVSSDQISSKFTSSLEAVTGKSKETFENVARSANSNIEKTSSALSNGSNESQQVADLVTHRWVVAQPGAKIGIKSEGLYRVTRAELQSAGFAVTSNSANWRLFMEGVEQSIIVGANDQYIEFYGKGRDDVESDTRVYYLIADAVAGKRIGTSILRPIGGAVVSNNFRIDLEKKERISYDPSIQNGDADNYFGRTVSETATTLTFNLPGIDLSAALSFPVTLKMFGGFTTVSHTVLMVINGHDVGTISGDGQNSFSGQKSVLSTYLVEGINTLDLTATGPQGDLSYFDSITVNYARKYEAGQNRLKFDSPNRRNAILSGFASPDIRVFDISSDGQPVQVTNLPVIQSGCSYGVKIPSYRGKNLFAQGATPDPRTAAAANWNVATDEVTFTDHRFFTGMKGQVTSTGILPGGLSASTDYYVRITGCNTASLFDTYDHAVNTASNIGKIDLTSTGSGDHTITASSVLQAASVTQNNPSTLSTVNHNANLVIISYSAPDFIAAANAWANFRRTQGFSVEVVDVADIYDEFNYGSLSSASIKNFLSFARTWNTPPQYVLLLGDATYDPRNYEGFGDFDLVPTKLVDTPYTGQTASDDALADFNDDGLAEMAIGRIPARTASDITTAFNKTRAFETPAQQSFNRGGLFAYDLPIGYDFQAASQILRNELPTTMVVQTVGRGDTGDHAFLINQMNTGKYIVNYEGHGSSGLWGASNFFSLSNNDVSRLTNASNQSIFVMLTCLNGYFIKLDFDSMSESLLKSPNGGAVVTWSSTADTTPDVQLVMGQRFYNQLAAGNITRMGDLIRDAKAVIPYGTDVRFSWALLGDPMLKVR